MARPGIDREAERSLGEDLSTKSREVAIMTTSLEIALRYIGFGWSPIPVPYKQKGPTQKRGWQNLRITAATAPRYFNGAAQNVGVLLGDPSHGLTDVDLDCIEAVNAAPYFLQTTHTFGRASKPVSHWLYITALAGKTGVGATIQFKDLTDPAKKAVILEVRVGGDGKGAQTVFPGSTHPSGEDITWADNNIVTSTDGDDLLQRTTKLAACALIARNYPRAGGRHDAALVLGGFLARCGYSVIEVKLFSEAVAVTSSQPGDKRRDIIKTAGDAAQSFIDGRKAAGLPRMGEVFGEVVAKQCGEWLGYKGDPSALAANGATLGFTEDSLAIVFVERHELRLRYVADWGKWLAWTATHWEIETTLMTWDEARKICREAAAQANKPSISVVLSKAKTVVSIETLARSDRRVAARVSQWDAGSWDVNTPEGVTTPGRK